MRITVRAPDSVTARLAAEKKAGGQVHISCVHHVPYDKTVRDWTFTTYIQG